jgi:beta-lactamase superfamily II metal-dependent hydrolase
MYGRYLLERADEIAAGAVHYTAAECIEQDKAVFDLGGATMTILDSYYYYNEAHSENDYSVCTLFTYGDYNYLFTGDLEEDGEEKLVEMNTLPAVDLYKAGHHGSKTSSSAALLSVIQPDIVCVCCCAGSDEYTKTNENQFPTQAFIDRVAPYTDKIYVTTLCTDNEKGTFQSMNGNITVIADNSGLSVICSSGDSRVLKEWEWFKENRSCPTNWQS